MGWGLGFLFLGGFGFGFGFFFVLSLFFCWVSFFFFFCFLAFFFSSFFSKLINKWLSIVIRKKSNKLILPPFFVLSIRFSICQLSSVDCSSRTRTRTKKNSTHFTKMQREIKKADMSDDMVKDATHFAQQAIGQQQPVVEARVAQFIKEKFDASYGAGWQCIVGLSSFSFLFSSFLFFSFLL